MKDKRSIVRNRNTFIAFSFFFTKLILEITKIFCGIINIIELEKSYHKPLIQKSLKG